MRREVGVEILVEVNSALTICSRVSAFTSISAVRSRGGGENVLGAVGGYRNGVAHGGDAARIRISVKPWDLPWEERRGGVKRKNPPRPGGSGFEIAFAAPAARS